MYSSNMRTKKQLFIGVDGDFNNKGIWITQFKIW